MTLHQWLTWMESEVRNHTFIEHGVTLQCVCLEYKLVAFVSHMGTSTMCGHYVCHILKEQEGGGARWVIYNDNKVAVSEAPPKQLGYLYLYQRQQ